MSKNKDSHYKDKTVFSNGNTYTWKKQGPGASFTEEVNPCLAKCPLKTIGYLANFELTSLVKEATGV